MDVQYHLQYTPPNKALEHWPQGHWSLYQITGDEIANRIVFKEIVPEDQGPAFYKGPVIARHSWCGFVGCYHTLADASVAILKRTSEVEAHRLREAAKAA